MSKKLQKVDNRIAIFEWNEVRKIINNDEWWFSIEDIIYVLTESLDPKQYIKKMRTRDLELKNNWGTICTPLEMIAKDWKKRKILSSNTEWILRIIQSIPSPRAEPFKMWLAKVWYERIKEIENPELAMNRMIETYEKKWYLRDWMTPTELILTMLAEQATTDITKIRNAKWMWKLKKASKDWWGVAFKARQELIEQTWKDPISKDHYLEEIKENRKLKWVVFRMF